MIWVLTAALAISTITNIRLLVTILSLRKFDGEIIIEHTPDRVLAHMEFNDDPKDTLDVKERVIFKVIHQKD